MNPNDPSSLMNAIQQYYQMLQQNQAATNAQGVNPQILQGQQGVDLARVAAAQGIVNAPLEQTTQPWIVDPANSNSGWGKAALATHNALLSQGPPSSNPNEYGGIINGFNVGAVLADQQKRDYYKRLEDSAFNMNLYGTKILSPAERQMLDEKMQAGRLDNASGLLAGTKPMPGVDPNQLGMFGALAQKDIESKDKLVGEKFKAQGELAKANSLGQIELSKQQLANEGSLAAAQATARNKPPTVYEMKAQEQADEARATAARAEDIGLQFNPEFYLTRTAWKAKLGDAFEKQGIPNDVKPKGYDQFYAGVNDVINNYLKITGGPRGMSNEKAREYILRSMFDDAKDASSASANLVDFIAKYHVAANLAAINAEQAAQRGQRFDPSSPEAKALVDKKMAALDPKAFEMARQEVIKKIPNLAPGYDPSRPYKNLSPEEIQAKIAQLRQSSLTPGM